MLSGGLVVSFILATLVAAPFDLDAGAGHAVFHFLLAAGAGLTSVLLWRHQPASRGPASVLARWSIALFAVAQLIEAIAAVSDPDGSSTGHGIPNFASLLVLQPLVLISLVALIVTAIVQRGRARA